MKEIMNRGWIKLHRKLRESAIYNEGLVFLLVECLFSATHKDINIDYAGTETILCAGQFVFGRHQWAKRLKINESTLYKRITKLTKYGIISVVNRNSSSGTIYQIEKWNEYQHEEQLSNSSVTAKEQLGNTNKNDKNYKNDNNIKEKRIEKKSPSIYELNDFDFQKIAIRYNTTLPMVRSSYDDMVNWHESSGKQKKDWIATLRNFVKKDVISIKTNERKYARGINVDQIIDQNR